MLPSRDTRLARALSALPGLAVVIAASVVLLATLHRATPGLYCIDGYYHIRYAEILRHHGPSRAFPWWQETFLRDHWADKDFLYHLLLIPFTLGDLLSGAKLSAILFGSAAVGIFYLVVRRLGAPGPVLWSLGLLASSSWLLYRLDFTRPWVLAVSLALAGTCAILLGRARYAFLAAALYPWAHISFHLLPCVALLHQFHRPGSTSGGRSSRVLLWTAAGAATGILVSPFFPNNLRLWWVQNVGVLDMAWRTPVDLNIGQELLPGHANALLRNNLGLFAALLVGVYLLVSARRASPEARTLLVVSSGFLALTMLSRRFVEFWAPFTMLFAAVAARDLNSDAVKDPASGAEPVGAVSARGGFAASARWAAVLGLCAGGAALLGFNARSTWAFMAKDEGTRYESAALWMRAHVPAGETIFHLSWGDFPQLFFFDPQLRYLVGLDPTFMYATDPERWRIFDSVGTGEADDLFGSIRRTFGCRYVFATSDAEEFLLRARRDPRFSIGYEDTGASVFVLTDDRGFVADWSLTGWWADPARRLFGVPLGPEPRAGADSERAGLARAAPAPTPSRMDAAAGGRRAARAGAGSAAPADDAASPPDPEGPGAAGLLIHDGTGFIDLERLLEIPAPVKDVCAVATTRLEPSRGGPVRIAVTTDDEIRVWIDGKTVLANSPYLNPPPGQPGGPPLSLDAPHFAGSHVPEQRVDLVLEPGVHALVVKTCRVGEDFGFHLSAAREDGAPLTAAADSR